MNLKRPLAGLLSLSMMFGSLAGMPELGLQLHAADEPVLDHNTYQISSVEDLMYAAEHPDKNYILTQDIDLTAQKDWEGIGTQEVPFSGVFDGAGHTITIDMDKVESEQAIHYVGLFGCVSGTVANLNVDGTLDADIYAGFIGPVAASLCGGTVLNCTSDVDVTAGDSEGASHVGGVVGGISLSKGNPSGTVQNCTNNGSIHVTSRDSGSLVQMGSEDLEKGTNGGIGGIVGFVSAHSKAEISYCINNGDMTITNWKNNIGGIVGQTSSNDNDTIANISYCANKGDLTVNNLQGERAAGIIGYIKGGTIQYCYNLGSIKAFDGEGNPSRAGYGTNYGIWGYSSNGSGNPLKAVYCYNASAEPLEAEICVIRNAQYVTAENFYMAGRDEYETELRAGNTVAGTPGTEFTDANDLFQKLSANEEAAKGYVANPDGGWPMLAFELDTSLEGDQVNGLIYKQEMSNDVAAITFLFQVPNSVGTDGLALSAQLLRGETVEDTVEMTALSDGESIQVGDRTYVAAEGCTLYAGTLNGIPDSLWITAVLTATKGEETLYTTSLVNDNAVVVPGDLPEYPDGTLSKTYNAGPGLASDQYDETDEDSDMVVISGTSKETYTQYVQDLLSAGYEQVSHREVEGNLYDALSKDGRNFYLYFTAYSNQVRIIWDKSTNTALEDLDTDPLGSGSTEFYLYSLDYTNSAKPLVDAENQINCGALMIIKLPDNSLFVIDSGHRRQSSDAAQKGLMDFMYKVTGQTYGSKINIKGWFISHAHGDHVYLSHAFLETYHDNLNIESMLYNIPSYQVMSSGYDTGTFLMKQSFETYFPDMKYVKLHTGQTFDIQGVNFQVLHTHEDAVNENGVNTITDFNDTSTTLKVTIDGKSFMLLGDSGTVAQQDMLSMYTAQTLKSDVVQIAHHGYNDLEALYDQIAAPLAIVPNSEANAKDGNPTIYDGYAKEGVTVLFADPDTYKLTVKDGEIQYEALPSYRDSLSKYTVSDLVLNIGSDASERNVTWYSDDSAAGTVQLAKKSDFVNGEFPTNYQEFQATTSTSSEGLTINKATITGLEENTEYVYRVGTQDGWSPIYSLQTLNFSGDFSFLLAGDPQIGSGDSVESDGAGWSNTLSKSLSQFSNIHFLISVGDQVDSAANEEQYDAFLSPAPLKSLALATNMGNHESGDTAYAQHFNTPNNSSLGMSDIGQGDYWYTYNNVLFMSLNSNNMNSQEHKQFMEETIQNHGQDADWTVVTFHHSMYSVANHSDDEDVLQRQAEMSPIFSELGIDVVLMGHDHVYTRTYMMDGTTPVIPEDGSIPSSVTDPAEGQVLYVTANSSSGSKYYNIRNVEFPYAAVMNQEQTPNITKIDVTANSFTITTYRVSDMSVVDTFTINRTSTEPTVSSVTVSPETATVEAGKTQSFQAVVTGENDPAQTVTWTVSGNTSAGTTIDANGLLTVATDETATQLVVTATSTVDASKSDYATVTVSQPVHQHNLVQVPAKGATCTEDGNIAYWVCQTCGAYFADGQGNTSLTWDEIVVPAIGHTLVKTEAKDPTATENGNIAYWTCQNCGKLFRDEAGTQEITLEETILPATGSEPTDPSEPSNPSEGGEQGPNTGDGAPLVSMAALLVLSGLAVVALRKRQIK